MQEHDRLVGDLIHCREKRKGHEWSDCPIATSKPIAYSRHVVNCGALPSPVIHLKTAHKSLELKCNCTVEYYPRIEAHAALHSHQLGDDGAFRSQVSSACDECGIG